LVSGESKAGDADRGEEIEKDRAIAIRRVKVKRKKEEGEYNT